MVLAVLDARGRAGEQRRQRWLARIEAGGPKVMAVEVEQVEDVVDQAAGRPGRERLLKRAEAADARGVERDDLAIEDGGRRRQFADVAGDLAEAARPV